MLVTKFVLAVLLNLVLVAVAFGASVGIGNASLASDSGENNGTLSSSNGNELAGPAEKNPRGILDSVTSYIGSFFGYSGTTPKPENPFEAASVSENEDAKPGTTNNGGFVHQIAALGSGLTSGLIVSVIGYNEEHPFEPLFRRATTVPPFPVDNRESINRRPLPPRPRPTPVPVPAFPSPQLDPVGDFVSGFVEGATDCTNVKKAFGNC